MVNPLLSVNQDIAQEWLSSVGVSQSNAMPGAFTSNLDQYNARTGSGLTTQQIQQMQYDVYQKNVDRQREDSVNQRTVADMKAAGVNPSLALGGNAIEAGSGSSGGGIAPSSTADVSQNPMSWLGTIQNLMMSGIGMAQGVAQIDKIKADADLVRTETEEKNLDIEFKQASLPDRIEQEKYKVKVQQSVIRFNDMSTEEKKTNIDKALHEIDKIDAEKLYNQTGATVNQAQALLTYQQYLNEHIKGEYLDEYYSLVNQLSKAQLNKNDAEIKEIGARMVNLLHQNNLCDAQGRFYDQKVTESVANCGLIEADTKYTGRKTKEIGQRVAMDAVFGSFDALAKVATAAGNVIGNLTKVLPSGGSLVSAL